MKVLVVGGGGREHAIIWKIKQSKSVSKIFCAPGNAGIAALAECVPIEATDTLKLMEFAKANQIDFTIVGMDDPLVMGIVDLFEKNGLVIFGPRKNAAEIEGSKAFSKSLMQKYNIPTAKYKIFDNLDKAKSYLAVQPMPVVVKADGLALGKGVFICQTPVDAHLAVEDMMLHKKFGNAGNKVVIEEFLTGPEVSVLSFCDGKHISPMVSAQDHKRVYDNDFGPNTGGMGTFSPSRLYTDEIAEYCMENIFKPTVAAMKKEGRPFKGILYFGLILTKDGPKVLEYNARFGDPETQVILPRLKTDLIEIFKRCVSGTLSEIEIKWEDNAAVCVVMASGGYPGAYKKGYEITGLDNLSSDCIVFHAGTAFTDNKIATNGGRVLGVTGIADNLDDAIKTAYDGVSEIDFKYKHFRKDIGVK